MKIIKEEIKWAEKELDYAMETAMRIKQFNQLQQKCDSLNTLNSRQGWENKNRSF